MPKFVDEEYLLFEAVKAGREEKVRALLNSGFQGDPVDAEGRSPLHWACQYGHLPIACLLLSSAAISDSSCYCEIDKDELCSRCGGQKGHSQSHQCQGYYSQGSESHISNCNHAQHRLDDNLNPVESELRRCLCKEKDRHYYNIINRRDAKGQTPLHVACNFRREDVASFLATLPLCELDLRDSLGHTPLHRAIHANLETLACLLCDVGADVHISNSFQWTPLHEAARTGNENVVRTLLAKRCDVNAVTHNGMTPFLTAIFYYKIAQRSSYRTLDNVLKLLIEAGCQLSQGDSQWTPLSASVAVDNSFIASMLLCSGCRFEKSCRSYGKSLLVEAFARCEPFVVRLLVLCGYQLSFDEIEQCSRRIPSFSPIFLRLPVANVHCTMKEKYELLHWLRQRVRLVPSLMELSRNSVRMGLNMATKDTIIIKRIHKLPLPVTIRDYVGLSDFSGNLCL